MLQPAVRKPANTETAVQSSGGVGWTQSFARTRGRSRRTRSVLLVGGRAVKRGWVHNISNVHPLP
jgi:hypothetical protein